MYCVESATREYNNQGWAFAIDNQNISNPKQHEKTMQ